VHRSPVTIEIDNEKRPHLWRGGCGVHKRGQKTAEQPRRPELYAAKGVVGAGKRVRDLSNTANWEKRPSLGKGARGVQRAALSALQQWMQALAERLRRVRVCCGDWTRVLGRSSTELIGVTGVLLDPPYSAAAGRDPSLYSTEDLAVAHQVREWAIANGGNPKLRIALCGYEGEHDMPATWQCVPWKAAGGYAASAGNYANAARERIWFSPACLRVEKAQHDLFGGAA